MEQKKKTKVIIIILAVLLGLSLLALAGTLIRARLTDSDPGAVTVPDNLITPEEDTGTEDTRTPGSGAGTSSAPAPAQSGTGTSSAPAPAQSAAAAQKAASIALYNKHPEDNTPFTVGNMFPGDSETKYFCVQVSYHDKVTVHYKAVVRPGYEKLAQVLQVRVKLLNTGETLYDGGIAAMPQSLTHKLASESSVTQELYYEITAYLDTSVGNAYQNQDLIADFKWWVEETGSLDSPETGDASRSLLWAVAGVCSGGLLLLLVLRRRKEDEADA